MSKVIVLIETPMLSRDILEEKVKNALDKISESNEELELKVDMFTPEFGISK